MFGPGRAALLAAELPATDAQAAEDLQAREAGLKARIARIETAQNAKILELEDLPADPADPAGQAFRARIRARFAELHEERERLEAQLKALANTAPAAADTSLLDRLPLAGDVLPRLSPAQSPAVPGLRHHRAVEQARTASHRNRRDHRGHPPGLDRHPRPRPGWLPRHRR